jgi:hypothetical protein
VPHISPLLGRCGGRPLAALLHPNAKKPRVSRALNPQPPNHPTQRTTTCHPDRSEAKWRDLRFITPTPANSKPNPPPCSHPPHSPTAPAPLPVSRHPKSIARRTGWPEPKPHPVSPVTQPAVLPSSSKPESPPAYPTRHTPREQAIVPSAPPASSPAFPLTPEPIHAAPPTTHRAAVPTGER